MRAFQCALHERMKLVNFPRTRHFSSRVALFSAMIVVSTFAKVQAAELVMFEQAACTWCEVFDREIAPIYPKTTEGQRAPLRRVNIDRALPPDLAFIDVERLAPLFVLVQNGHEIGRIRGYPGEDNFWGLLGVLIKKLDSTGTSGERTPLREKSLHVAS